MTKKKEKKEEKVEEIKKDEQIVLLEEIRDLLKEKQDCSETNKEVTKDSIEE